MPRRLVPEYRSLLMPLLFEKMLATMSNQLDFDAGLLSNKVRCYFSNFSQKCTVDEPMLI